MNAEQYGRAAFQAQAYDERVYGTSISLPSAYNYTWHRGDNGIAAVSYTHLTLPTTSRV